jgi:hypothetical protein
MRVGVVDWPSPSHSSRPQPCLSSSFEVILCAVHCCAWGPAWGLKLHQLLELSQWGWRLGELAQSWANPD